MKRRILSALVIMLAVLVIFTGCNPAPSAENGSVKIFLSAAEAKAIMPSEDWDGLDIAKYEITALDKDGKTVYSTTVEEIPAEIEISLPIGRYSFNASAYDADNVKVATADSELIAVTSKSVPEVKLVLDLTGEGSVEISYSFAENTVLKAGSEVKVTAVSLNDLESDPIAIAVDADAKKATAALAADAYLVLFQADVESTTEGIGTKFVKTDILYVESGKTSVADWVVSYEGSNASIEIDSNVGAPISLSISTTEGVEYDSASNKYYIPEGQSVVFTVYGADEDKYDYQWAYNGEEIENAGTSATLTIDEVSLGKLILFVSSNEGTSYGYGLQEWTIEVIPSEDVKEGIYISTAEALREFAAQVAAGNPTYTAAKAYLVADIDLEGKAWTPIADFVGSFDGQGYSVDNLKIDASENASIALFEDGASVSNLSYGSVEVINFKTADAEDKRLDEVLKLDAEAISVKLSGDASITANDAYLKLGSENTELITIEGTGAETLTLTTTYWSRINLVNPEAKIVIKNVNLTSSQESGTWNSYDITFMCNVELDNVNCLKAVALDGAKLATLKNVSISETHDYYALWITTSCEQVDIDGLNVSSEGRGIKIDEQYVSSDDSNKVILNIKNSTFDTNKKSAIIVKNAKGAVITVENVDISKAAADTVNTVWIDEASSKYASMVQVYGASYIVEGTKELPADAEIADLRSELSSGSSIILTEDMAGASASGGYSKAGIVVNGGCLDGNGNTLTVDGANSTWDCVVYNQGGIIRNLTVKGGFRGIFTAGCNSDIIIDNVIFEDVVYTISSDGSNPNYSIIVTNSTLNGWTSYSGGYKSVSFTNCRFGEGSGYAYCRPYSDTTFTDCVFDEGFGFDSLRCTSTFVNCKVGETLITDENKVELLGDGAANLVIKNN